MFGNNSDGLVLLTTTAFIVVGTIIWNAVLPKKYRLTFDNAEKMMVYLLAAVLVLVAVYSILIKR